MGLLFVLIFYGLVFGGAAVVGTFFLRALGRSLTRGRPGADRAVFLATRLPFACFIWLVVWFLATAFFNANVRRRDIGTGDGWQTPLANGHQLQAVDIVSQGNLLNAAGDTIVASVTALQLQGPYICGTCDPTTTLTPDAPPYCVVDTRTGLHTALPTYAALSQAAESHCT